MDQLFIQGLELMAIIGVHDWERETKQRLVLNLELETDIRPAAAQDSLTLTLDYADISHQIERWVAQSRFQLIESLAEDIAAKLREHFGVTWLYLKLHKPGAVATAKSVGVAIERGQPERTGNFQTRRFQGFNRYDHRRNSQCHTVEDQS